MKKLIFYLSVFLIMFTFSKNTQAQEYDEGSFFGHFGVGLASPIFEEDHQTQIPLITLNVEKAVMDNLTVGGLLGYTASRSTAYRFLGDHYFYQHQFGLVMARATWHQQVFDQETFDFYGGLGLGAKIGKASYRGRGDLEDLQINPTPASSGFIYSVYVGGHYYLNDNFRFFIEGGLGATPVSIGLHFNL